MPNPTPPQAVNSPLFRLTPDFSTPKIHPSSSWRPPYILLTTSLHLLYPAGLPPLTVLRSAGPAVTRDDVKNWPDLGSVRIWG